MITIIDKQSKTVKKVTVKYKQYCDEAFINVTDAVKMRLTEDDLLKFIIKPKREL